MTEPKETTKPKAQNSPEAPNSEKTRPADATGFFNRVRRELNAEEEPHPTEAAEIVIMEEEEGE
jgi:hypothetical protein